MSQGNTTITETMLASLAEWDASRRDNLPGEWEALESAGLIEIRRPVHSTGVPYDQSHWDCEITEDGADRLEARPDLYPADR